MTLDEVANKSSLTKSFISQIELNKTSPSITSLMKVASALEIKLTDLFREEGPAEGVLIKKQTRDSYYNKKKQGLLSSFSPLVFPTRRWNPFTSMEKGKHKLKPSQA